MKHKTKPIKKITIQRCISEQAELMAFNVKTNDNRSLDSYLKEIKKIK